MSQLERDKVSNNETLIHDKISSLAMMSWQSSLLDFSHFQELSQIIQKGEELNQLYKHIPSSFTDLKTFLKKWFQKDQKQNEKEMEWCKKKDVFIVYPGHRDFPSSLLEMEEPPLILTYRGQACWKEAPSLSVVGSRKPSLDSLNWLDEYFTEVLKRKRILVISGAAQGIDQKTHALSLRLKIPTLSILPSGLGEIYPSSFQEWTEFILQSGGALMSAVSPFQKVYRSLFHKRNQLIAAFSPLLFVVEARRRSGSLLTASMALELGKSICTLPCSPMNKRGQGSLDLIFAGAFMLRDDKDILSLLDRYF